MDPRNLDTQLQLLALALLLSLEDRARTPVLKWRKAGPLLVPLALVFRRWRDSFPALRVTFCEQDSSAYLKF